MISERNIAVVILNWNGKDFLAKFLPSVIENNNNLYHIYVIDNGSTDKSIELLKSTFPEVRLVLLDQNLGFAGGYNEGLKQINEEYYVLLNSDVEVKHAWIEPLLNLCKSNSNIVACQPKILAHDDKNSFEYAGAAGGYMDHLGYPFCRGRIFGQLEKDQLQYEKAQSIFWASGCALFIEKDIFWRVNGLDIDLFAHQEEIDLCWRIQNLGYEIWVEPKSIVYHLGGGTLNQGSPNKDYLNFRNNLIIILKNHPYAYKVLSKRVFLDLLAMLKLIVDGKSKNAFAILRAYKDFISSIGHTLSKRRLSTLPKSLLSTMYPKSIVFQFYAKRIKKFKDLNWL